MLTFFIYILSTPFNFKADHSAEFNYGKPISICISGLDISNIDNKDNHTFLFRAMKLSNSLQYEYMQVSSGKELLNNLVLLTRRFGSIENLIIFSHGDSNGIFFTQQNGFYSNSILNELGNSNYGGGKEAEYVSTFNEMVKSEKIIFQKNGSIVLMACNSYSMAEQLSVDCEIISVNHYYASVNDVELQKETGCYYTDNKFINHDINHDTAHIGNIFHPYYYLKNKIYLTKQILNK